MESQLPFKLMVIHRNYPKCNKILLKIRIGFWVLIKHLVRFEDIATYLTTRIHINIKFNNNLQLGSGLTVAPKLYNVQLGQMRSLFLLLQACKTIMARQIHQNMRISKDNKFTFLWSFHDSI